MTTDNNVKANSSSDRTAIPATRRYRVPSILLGTFHHRTRTRWSPITCTIVMLLISIIASSGGGGGGGSSGGRTGYGIYFASAEQTTLQQLQQQPHDEQDPSSGSSSANAQDDDPTKVRVRNTTGETQTTEQLQLQLQQQPEQQLEQQPEPELETPTPTVKPTEQHNTIPHNPPIPTSPLTTTPNPPQMTLSQILIKAGRSSLNGGIPGAIAGVCQVLSLMWLRTITKYQIRYGTSFRQALITLYRQDGLRRFYRGVGFALVQAPLVRFVGTAANDGVETLLGDLEATKAWGPGKTTVVASVVVGVWRLVLMPIDTCKTVLQVDSVEGFRDLMRKLRAGKIGVLYTGSLANVVSAIVSHYPFFYTFNYLSRSPALHRIITGKFLRNAAVGFLSSVVSDSTSNVLRVIKTTKQTFASKRSITYSEIVGTIVASDGLKGLFGRGLRTRILGNAVQSVLFVVIWRGLVERRNDRKRAEEEREQEEELQRRRSGNSMEEEAENVEEVSPSGGGDD